MNKIKGTDISGNEWIDLDLKLDQVADKLVGSLFREEVITVRESSTLSKNLKKFLDSQFKNVLK